MPTRTKPRLAQVEHPFHPLAAGFPLMEGPEYAELVEDIRQHGLIEPIILLDGQIIDGRNRYRACIEAGIEPRYRPFDGDDPRAFVISANAVRRQLTAEQKRAGVEAQIAANPEKSDRQIAKAAGVDKNTAAAVRRKMEGRGEIHHVSKRTDSKGRRQPARRPGGPKASPTRSTAPDLPEWPASPPTAATSDDAPLSVVILREVEALTRHSGAQITRALATAGDKERAAIVEAANILAGVAADLGAGSPGEVPPSYIEQMIEAEKQARPPIDAAVKALDLLVRYSRDACATFADDVLAANIVPAFSAADLNNLRRWIKHVIEHPAWLQVSRRRTRRLAKPAEAEPPPPSSDAPPPEDDGLDIPASLRRSPKPSTPAAPAAKAEKAAADEDAAREAEVAGSAVTVH